MLEGLDKKSLASNLKVPFKTGHSSYLNRFLPLPLFVLWIFADHPNDSFASNDLTLVTNLFDRSPDFHRFCPMVLTWSWNVFPPPFSNLHVGSKRKRVFLFFSKDDSSPR